MSYTGRMQQDWVITGNHCSHEFAIDPSSPVSIANPLLGLVSWVKHTDREKCRIFPLAKVSAYRK